MSELKCTKYIDGDWVKEGLTPCHCPVCGGFLAWDDPLTPKCNKCKSELIALPEIDEETGEACEWGKICPISLGRIQGLLNSMGGDSYA